jgi:division protein CdvB (Snf7/Vps24/ESCRT-III family)
MELITLTAAQVIAKIALDKFVEGGASELGKNLTTQLSQKVMRLGTIVWDRIRGNATAVGVLKEATQEKPEEIQRLKNYLYSLWKDENSEFTQDVKKLADEIHFELTQIEDNSSMTQINRDNARGWQTKVEGGTAYIGEIHQHNTPNRPQP